MTMKLGQMGQPRVGIALIWFLPAMGSASGVPEEKLSAEDREFFRSATGMEAEDALAHLRELGMKHEQDPEGLRAEILSMMEGDEVATEYLMDFIQGIAPGGRSRRTGKHEPEESTDSPGGQVVEFRHPAADEEDPGKRE